MTLLIAPLLTAGIAVGGIQNSYAGDLNSSPTAVAKDVTKSANDQCLADVTPQEVDDGSFDPDGDAISLSLSPTGPFSLGNTQVTLTVTDGSGASDSATATVTVVDTTPPDITVPDGFTAMANIEGGWSGDIGQATATDVCDSDVGIDNDAPDVFPLGNTVVEWCATDDSGNGSCAEQIITVIPLQVFVDQKPNSCPNSVNVNSRGLLPVAILGTETFDVNDIDISTLQSPGGEPNRIEKISFEDVATPFVGLKFNQFDCNELGPDGFDDLIFKIPMEKINCLPDGALGILIIEGALLDGTPIQGSDLAKIINKQGCS